ncbi:MAG: hypothetical protein H6703_14625 [Myxococcales bacterium]|nr:hypothetical protein [Myxococcales bacterium]
MSEAPAAPKAPTRTRAAEAPKAEAPAEAPKAAAPAAEAPKAEAPAGGDDMAERYREFVANLPERSRKFLELVKRKGIVTIEDAMNELDISVPKAMGGITGSIGRWAPVRGVPVPYEATTRDGERIWRWLGSPVDDDTGASAPAAPAAAEEAPAPAKASKGRGKGKAGKKEKAPAGRKGRAAKASPAEPAAAPAAPADDADAGARYREFLANLPERSQKFIDLVRDRGQLTITEAMDALGIDVPKAMGGITGSIGRWAPVRGVPIPYEATTIEGERAWKWVGGPGTGKAGASPKAEAPAGVTPNAAAPVGAKQTSSVTEQKTEQTMAPDPAKVEALIEALPERSALFVRTLRQRGVLTMPEVLERFSLAKARAVGGIIDPIQRACEELGMEVPFNSTFAPTGDKAWVWPGSEIRRSEPEPLTLPSFEATSAAPAMADEEGDAERGREAARPGVRVRRRGS